MRKNPEISEESHRFLANQMFERAAVAGPLHAIAYFILSKTIEKIQGQPWVMWVFGLICFVTVGRTLIWHFSRKINPTPKNRLILRLAFAALSLMLAAAWSGTTSKLLVDHGFNVDALMVNTALFAICAIAIPSFAYDLAVLLGFLQVSILPVVIASFLATGEHGLVFPISYLCFDIFFCYIAIGMHRFNIQNMHQIEVIGMQKATVEGLNLKMQTMVESLEEAILTITRDGRFQTNGSKRALELFGKDPSGQSLTDVLELQSEEKENAEKWVEMAFSGEIDFEILKDLGPTLHISADKRTVALRYRPIRNSQGAVQALVLVAEDISVRVAAQDEAKANLDHAEMILQIIKNPKAFKDYLVETESFLKQMTDGHLQPGPDLDRSLHNLKGSSALFRIADLAKFIHKTEVGIRKGENVEVLGADLLAYFANWQEEQNELLSAIMTSKPSQRTLKDAVDTYIGIAHSTAVKMGKSVRIKINENASYIMPDQPPRLFATLIHIFNNAIDHGIEKRKDRLAKGKPPEGTIEVNIDRTHESNESWIKLTFRDDGGGINENGLIHSINKSNPERVIPSNKLELFQIIFEDRISSKTEVSEISGMGTGLASVKAAAESLGGSAMVTESSAAGTTIEIKIPEHALNTSKAA